jgi:hypothetical protein
VERDRTRSQSPSSSERNRNPDQRSGHLGRVERRVMGAITACRTAAILKIPPGGCL